MYKVHCLNNISEKGLALLTSQYEITDNVDEADVILVRSANMKEMEFSANLKAVARAGAGVNNIPLDVLAEKGIPVFNTPGANANAVKELVLCGMLLASRGIVDGIAWCRENADDENGYVVFMKIEQDENGEDIYVSIDEDGLVDALFEKLTQILDEEE